MNQDWAGELDFTLIYYQAERFCWYDFLRHIDVIDCVRCFKEKCTFLGYKLERRGRIDRTIVKGSLSIDLLRRLIVI